MNTPGNVRPMGRPAFRPDPDDRTCPGAARRGPVATDTGCGGTITSPRSQTGASAVPGTLRRRPRRQSRPPWRCSNLRRVSSSCARRSNGTCCAGSGILVLGFTVMPESSTVSSTAVKRSPPVVRILTVDPIGRRTAYCRQTSASCPGAPPLSVRPRIARRRPGQRPVEPKRRSARRAVAADHRRHHDQRRCSFHLVLLRLSHLP